MTNNKATHPYSAFGIMERVVSNINSNNQDRNLVVRDEHDSKNFIMLTVREADFYRIGRIPIFPKKGREIYRMPVLATRNWDNLGCNRKIETLKSYTHDFDLLSGIEQERINLLTHMNGP